jgi:hypothetical protein
MTQLTGAVDKREPLELKEIESVGQSQYNKINFSTSDHFHL